MILLLAGVLRAWKITENPPELFPDEIVNFVSAKSVVENGHDMQGKLLPYFSDRLEPKPPIYGYTAYMSSKIFGEGIAGIRAPAVFFGLASILLVFLLAKELFGDTAAALFAAFFMAIIPWHIHYSRVAWDPASFLPFFLLSVYLFYYGINRDRKSAVVSSFGLFALTFYTYHVAPFYSSSFLAFLVVINGRYFLRERRVLIKGIAVFLILLMPYVWTLLAEPHMYDKASRISTFAGGINTYTLNRFFTNYISHYSPDFLFRYGDPNLRHGAGTGVIYWVMLPFLAAGIVYSAMDGQAEKRILFHPLLDSRVPSRGLAHERRGAARDQEPRWGPGPLPAEREGCVGARPDCRREGRAHVCLIYTLRRRRGHLACPAPADSRKRTTLIIR